MVGVKRIVAAACFAAALGAGQAFAQDDAMLTGAWGGELHDKSQYYRDYLRAEIVQNGRMLSGEGVVNLCAACAGFDEQPVAWSGYVKGDRIVLHAAYRNRPYQRLRFVGRRSASGESYVGAIWADEVSAPIVLLRQRNDDAVQP